MVNTKNIFIIGDTTNDIRCGKAIDATTIAFTSGFEPEEKLRTCSPDFMVSDSKATTFKIGRNVNNEYQISKENYTPVLTEFYINEEITVLPDIPDFIHWQKCKKLRLVRQRRAVFSRMT